MKIFMLVLGIINIIVIAVGAFFMIMYRNKLIYNDRDIHFNTISIDNIEQHHEQMFIYCPSYRNDDGNWANINTREAVLIAHLIVFNNNRDLEVDQPYTVYFDDDNDVYTIVGYSVSSPKDPVSVVVCKRTGGILRIIRNRHGWIPALDLDE